MTASTSLFAALLAKYLRFVQSFCSALLSRLREIDGDLLALNPYIESSSLDMVQRLLIITMRRANRVGQTNRCIGAAISLLELIDTALDTTPEDRAKAGETLSPRLVQASGDLGDGLFSKRHFINIDYVAKTSTSGERVASYILVKSSS